LVGWVPLHPPEAVQLSASVALHCKVAAVPAAMLLLIATRETAGVAAPPVMVVWPDEDCWQAASTENTAHPSTQRNARNLRRLRNDG